MLLGLVLHSAITYSVYEDLGSWPIRNSFTHLSNDFIVSIIHSFQILKRFKPDIVVGTGGFASGPLLQVAQWLGLPTLIQEQNSYPGFTNRILSKKADRICVAYNGMERFFPKEKLRLTGNPVRNELIRFRSNKKS